VNPIIWIVWKYADLKFLLKNQKINFKENLFNNKKYFFLIAEFCPSLVDLFCFCSKKPFMEREEIVEEGNEQGGDDDGGEDHPLENLDDVIKDIRIEQLTVRMNFISIFSFVCGATFYRRVLLSYRNHPSELRERLILEWTTLGVVAALLLSLSFALFLVAPRYTFNELNHIFNTPWFEIFGVASSLSCGALITSCLHFTLYVVNANLLHNEDFSVFVYQHIYIMAMPIFSLVGGILSMSAALVAYGYLGYNKTIAWFNLGFMLYNAVVFGTVTLYSSYCRTKNVFRATQETIKQSQQSFSPPPPLK
jgi:hypothetical protein